MPRKKRSKILPTLLALLIGGGILALWVGFSVGPPPQLSIASGHDGADEQPLLGPQNTLMITASESRRGVGAVRIEFEQAGRMRTLAEASHSFRSEWKPWQIAPHPQASLAVDINRQTLPDLREGPATVRIVAERSAGFLRSPEPVTLERSFTVRLKSPSLEIRSTTHYVAQGGSEVVLYQVGETCTTSGVQVGDWFFPGYPLPEGGAQDRFALYAVPYDRSEVGDLRVIAEDAVGNRAEKRFVDRFFPKPLGTDSIHLSKSFLEKVVPDILSQTPELQPRDDLLQGYLAINRDLREKNRAELRELSKKTKESFLWNGPFRS